jgi:hypothetical protein
MASAKIATLDIDIEPGLKAAVPTTAEREHRSIANMVAVMIRDYCGRNGVTIPEPDGPLNKKGRK